MKPMANVSSVRIGIFILFASIAPIIGKSIGDILPTSLKNGPQCLPDSSIAKDKWPKSSLTYRITKYSPKLPETTFDALVQKAFEVWARASQLTFTQVGPKDKADIHILFTKLFPNRLARSKYPSDGGIVQFNQNKNWTVSDDGASVVSDDWYSLFQVAVHEFGHVLGLDHSECDKAIMYKHYRKDLSNECILDPVDIEGIQTLYGEPTHKNHE